MVYLFDWNFPKSENLESRFKLVEVM